MDLAGGVVPHVEDQIRSTDAEIVTEAGNQWKKTTPPVWVPVYMSPST